MTSVARSVCRIALSVAAVSLIVAVPGASDAQAPIPGPNVNMVTGLEFPDGDPFLQRQNEPSIAVSSVNARHLLAGANDYRAVDLAAVQVENSTRTGDAWLGVFKSLDEGQTWKSTLLPGYPGPACNQPSPGSSCSFQAGADPVVRAGTDGMLYYAGLLFDRDRSKSRIAVSRFFDRNDSEVADFAIDSAADPIEFLSTSGIVPDGRVYETAHEGCAVAEKHVHFLDKPWIAVDVPRGGAATCSIALRNGTTRSFPGGAVYVAYVEFVRPVKAVNDQGRITTLGSELSGTVKLSRSDDCGASWSSPVALTTPATSAINEGPAVAIDPTTAKVYVVWRRVATPTQPDAIMVSRSFSRGTKFTKPRIIATLPAAGAFDHPQGFASFRAWALPTFAISVGSGGNRHLHVAWAQRDGADGPGRIVMSTANVSPPPPTWQEGDETEASADHWSAPAPMDPSGASGREARVQAPFTANGIAVETKLSFSEGHQFMPALTYSQGRLVLVYYDSRFDHTRGLFKPNVEGGKFKPDADGRFYTEIKAPMTRTTGGRQWDPLDFVFGPESAAEGVQSPPRIDDRDVAAIRHTVDVRVAFASPGPAPVFSSVQMSQYPFGRRGDEALLLTGGELRLPAFKPNGAVPSDGELDVANPHVVVELDGGESKLKLLSQLRQNPPNLPLFASGTQPFIGDYIDVQGPAFVRKGSGWDFNTAPSAAPVFHAVWTSNQDVRRPPPTCRDGSASCTPDQLTIDWTRYTPVPVTCGDSGCKSAFDGTTPIACTPGFEGSRDQNVYTSRITEGLLVSSPQNAKALSATAFRTFVVLAQNATWFGKSVRFSVVPSSGVVASFQDPTLGIVTTLDAAIPARSSAARTVTAYLLGSSNPAASITVRVDELDPSCDVGAATSCPVAANGASATVVLNPPGSPASLFAGGADEDYTPLLVNTTLTPADPLDEPGAESEVASHDIASHDIASHDIASHDIASHDIASHDIASHDIETVENASHDIASHDIASHDIASHDIASHDIEDLASASHDIASHDIAALSDATYAFKNDGTTTAAYDVVIAGERPTYTTTGGQTEDLPVQLVITKVYRTPTAYGCERRQQPHTIVLVNVPDVSAAIVPLTGAYPPSARNASAARATVTVESGAEIYVTLRAIASLEQLEQITRKLQPVVIPQADPFAILDPDTCPASGCTFANAVRATYGTVTTLDVSPDPAFAGEPVTLTATVNTTLPGDGGGLGGVDPGGGGIVIGGGGGVVIGPGPIPIPITGAPVPQGWVSFWDGTAVEPLGVVPVVNGVAVLTTILAAGDHSLFATYADGSPPMYGESSSAPELLAVGVEMSAFGVPADIDGIAVDSEWADAACATEDYDGGVALRFCIKNDATNLYFMATMTQQMLQSGSSQGLNFLRFDFDEDLNFVWDSGEDGVAIRLVDGLGVDVHTLGLGSAYSDAAQEIVGMSGFSGDAVPGTIGMYTVEWQHPLVSGDSDDITAVPGQVLNFRFEWDNSSDPTEGGAMSYRWPLSGWSSLRVASPPPN